MFFKTWEIDKYENYIFLVIEKLIKLSSKKQNFWKKKYDEIYDEIPFVKQNRSYKTTLSRHLSRQPQFQGSLITEKKFDYINKYT